MKSIRGWSGPSQDTGPGAGLLSACEAWLWLVLSCGAVTCHVSRLLSRLAQHAATTHSQQQQDFTQFKYSLTMARQMRSRFSAWRKNEEYAFELKLINFLFSISTHTLRDQIRRLIHHFLIFL